MSTVLDLHEPAAPSRAAGRTPARPAPPGDGQRVPDVLAGSSSPHLLVVGLALVGSLVIGVAAAGGWVVGVAGLLAVAFGLAVLLRPAVGGLALVWFVPFLSGLARGLVPIPGAPPLKVTEGLVGGVAVVVLLACGRRGTVSWGRLDLALLAYVVGTVGLGLLDMHTNGIAISGDTFTKLLGSVQFLLLFRAVRVSLPTPDLRRLAVQGLLLVSVVMSLIGIAQVVLGGRLNALLVRLTHSTAADRHGDATALFAGKHDLGGYLLVVLLVAVALLLTPRQRVLPRAVLVALLVVTALALALSVALASVAGAVLGVVLMARRRRRLGPALVVGVMVAAIAAVLFGSTLNTLAGGQFDSPPVVTAGTNVPSWVPHGVAYRATVWQDQYLPALSPYLATGYGPTLPPGVNWQYTESAYLSFMLLGGLPLLILFGVALWQLWSRAVGAQRDTDPTQQALGLALAALAIVLVVIDVTNPYVLNAGLPHAMWALAGLLVVDRPGRRSRRGAAAERATVTRPAVVAPQPVA